MGCVSLCVMGVCVECLMFLHCPVPLPLHLCVSVLLCCMVDLLVLGDVKPLCVYHHSAKLSYPP